MGDSAGDVAQSVDHVITCLPSPSVTARVLNDILPVMHDGQLDRNVHAWARDDVLRLPTLHKNMACA